MTTLDKLANELFPCPSNCPSKQMTAKYMRENFKQAVNLVVDEIRRANGGRRVTPHFVPSFPSGGIIEGHQMTVTGRDEGPEYVLTDEQLEKIGLSITDYDGRIVNGNSTFRGVKLKEILGDEASRKK